MADDEKLPTTAENCSPGAPVNVATDPAAPAVWQNITDEFFGAVKDLKLGELVRNEIFGLFEAMSAIEMMDPKMDAAMCCNKRSDPPLTFETAISAKKLKLNDLTAAELIGLMDGMWSCLVSWLEGHSIAQTLFTCLYLHQPNLIKDKALRAFCLGMLKLTSVIQTIIFRAEVSEEEDFEVRFYEFDMQQKLSEARACVMLMEIEDQLLRRNNNRPATAETAADHTAIGQRLRFLRLLLESLVAIGPKDSVSPSKLEVAEIQKLLASALDAIPLIQASIERGTQALPDADEPNPMGFSPHVNQRMLPPTFPRFTKIKDRAESVAFLEAMTRRLRTVCNIIKSPTYHGNLNFFIDFSRQAPTCLLSRSVLQKLYLPRTPSHRFGVTPFADVLRDSIGTFDSPPVLTARHPMASNENAQYCFAAFLNLDATRRPFIGFLQLCGFNKARQRDKLVRLFVDFAAVSEEAERVDMYMQSRFFKDHAGTAAQTGVHVADIQQYFGTWILYHSLRAMHLYLLVGIELELYAPHEFVYVFWYLSQNICQWTATALGRAEQLAEHSRTVAARFPCGAKPKKAEKGSSGSSSSSAGGGPTTVVAMSAEQRRREWHPYQCEQVINQALSHMYSGYFRAAVAFEMQQRIRQPLSRFDKEQVRFEHRFAPFACNGTLPQVPYEDFAAARRSLMAEGTAETLYAEASACFQRARLTFESLHGQTGIISAPNINGLLMMTDQELTDIVRVVKVNLIVMNLMARGHHKDTTTAPTFDFSTHKYYPTIRIQ